MSGDNPYLYIWRVYSLHTHGGGLRRAGYGGLRLAGYGGLRLAGDGWLVQNENSIRPLHSSGWHTPYIHQAGVPLTYTSGGPTPYILAVVGYGTRRAVSVMTQISKNSLTVRMDNYQSFF